jgi:hypothetical protein
VYLCTRRLVERTLWEAIVTHMVNNFLSSFFPASREVDLFDWFVMGSCAPSRPVGLI